MVDIVVPPVVVPPVVVPPPAAWHAGLPPEIVGTAQSKGWSLDDPVKAFEAAAKAYTGAQSLVGMPPEKVLRMPDPTADGATLDAFWQRLGAVKDGKEIDLATVKGADGKPFDEKLAEVIRATAVTARAPKDIALATAAALQKHFDAEASAAKAVRDSQIATDKAALNTSWGANADRNMFVANQALEKLAAAAQVPMDKAKEAWDALSKVGGLGATAAINMLYEMGKRMGEDRYVAGGSGGGDNMPMTREAAAAEIAQLKTDAQFRQRLLAGAVDDTKRWQALHKIAYGQQAA